MNLTDTDISPTRKQVIVTFSGEEVKELEESCVRELASQARLPGFRPGKAPLDQVRKRHRREIFSELKKDLANKAYEHFQNELKLEVADVLELVTELSETLSEASVRMLVDFHVPFELPVYRGIETSLPSKEVSEEEVEQGFQQLLRERATYELVERAVVEGDYVKVSYKGTVDGQPIAEIAPAARIWGTQENTWEVAGPSSPGVPAVPAVVQALLGMQPGEQKIVEQVFEADFAEVPELAGKTASYSVEVTEVRELRLPPVDDTFLKSVQADSLQSLRERLRDGLRDQKEGQRDREQRAQISQALASRIEFHLPESVLEREANDVMRRIMQDNFRRGATAEFFEERKEEFYNSARNAAAQRLKVERMLSKIATKEGIEVTDDDLSRAIYLQALQSRTRPNKLVAELRKDRDRLRRIQRGILFEKTLDFLCKEATVSERLS